MVTLVRFPVVGTNIVEGTVGAWRRREGDAVRVGEPLVEMITSKATFEVESPESSILLRIFAPEKSNVPVNYILAAVGGEGESIPDVASENEKLLSQFRAQASPTAAEVSSAKVRATPGARRLAKEKGIDLAAIPPVPGRDILREEDVREFLNKERGLM